MTVPRGTMQDVLDWVGNDPGRAQEALDAERAGQNRSTLISQLEAICPREDNTVSESDPGAPGTDPGAPDPDPGTETTTPGTETGAPGTGTEPGTDEAGGDTESDEAGADTSVLDTDAGAADRDSDEEQLIGQEAPPQPEEVALNPSDEGTTVFATVPRSRDVELPEPVFGFPRPVATGPTTTGTVRVGMFDREVSDEEIDGEEIDGAQVEYLDGATNGAALALAFNGDVYLLDPQMAAALKGIMDKAIAGMAL